MTTILAPSCLGVLPEGFQEWNRGLTYTLRPEILTPETGRVYRFNVNVRWPIHDHSGIVSYRDIYSHAARIGEARLTELREAHAAASTQIWLAIHAWGRFSGPKQFAYASLTCAFRLASGEDSAPAGEAPPQPDDLAQAVTTLPPSSTPSET